MADGNGKWLGEFLKANGISGAALLAILGLIGLLLMGAKWALPYLDNKVSAVDSRTKATYSNSREIKDQLGYLEQSITGQSEAEAEQRKQEHEDILGAVRLGAGRLDRTLTQIDISLREQNRLFLVLCHNTAKDASAHRRCDGEQ